MANLAAMMARRGRILIFGPGDSGTRKSYFTITRLN
jgi:hypothetical protein